MTFLTSLIPMKLGRKRRDKERLLKVQSDEEQNFVPPIRFVPHLICLNKQRNFTSNQYSCCCALSSLGRFRFPSLRVASPPTSLPPRSPTVSVTVLISTLIVTISALLWVVPEMSVVAIASGAALASFIFGLRRLPPLISVASPKDPSLGTLRPPRPPRGAALPLRSLGCR